MSTLTLTLFNMKIKRIWIKQIPVTKRRLKTFLLPEEELISQIISIAEIFEEWKSIPTRAEGCLNGGYTVRTNLHKIPFSEVKHRIIGALSGTNFELTRNGRFKQRRREKLWRDSIERGEYIQTLPLSLDRTR